MKESYKEQPAIDFGHNPYAGSGDAPGVAWVCGDAGQPLNSEISNPVCRPCTDKGKATSSSPLWQGEGGHGGVGNPEHVSKFQAREPNVITMIRCFGILLSTTQLRILKLSEISN